MNLDLEVQGKMFQIVVWSRTEPYRTCVPWIRKAACEINIEILQQEMECSRKLKGGIRLNRY